MNYLIEDGVPLPDRLGGRCPSPEREAMTAMQVGQSFLIDDADRANAARWIGQKIDGKKFSVIKQGHEGWRVWRTK